MPVMDDSFQAFVTNLGKYNEGELVGEWVKFPTTEEEMQKVFERIGIGSKDEFGHVYEEWFITDYECPIYGVQKLLGEYESLDKLNYLASRIDEMDKWDQEKFVAIMEAGCDEVNDIDDLINLTYSTATTSFPMSRMKRIWDATTSKKPVSTTQKQWVISPTTLTLSVLDAMWQWMKAADSPMMAIYAIPETVGRGCLTAVLMTFLTNTVSPEAVKSL